MVGEDLPIVDVMAICRLYRDHDWTPLGECRIRLQEGALSLEVHDPNGPYCLDMTFDKIHLEIEERRAGPILYIRLTVGDQSTVVEAKGDSSQIGALADAISRLK